MAHKKILTLVLFLASSVVFANTQVMKTLKPSLPKAAKPVIYQHQLMQSFNTESIGKKPKHYKPKPQWKNCRAIIISCSNEWGEVVTQVRVPMLNILVNSHYQCLPDGQRWNRFLHLGANNLCRNQASVRCGIHGCHFSGGYHYVAY